jgi:arylsulfatase A-like enzyme
MAVEGSVPDSVPTHWSVPVPVLVALTALIACAPDAPTPHGVVLVLYDTVRADRLSLHGYARDTAPALEALAARGLVFEQASSTAPWTIPAVASLWTGLHPTQHGAGQDGERRQSEGLTSYRVFGEGLATLPRRMRELGYRTYGRIANPLVGVAAYTRDFEVLSVERSPASSLVDWVEQRVGELAEAPFFLYLHFMDAHVPLDPPEEYARRYLPDSFDPGALRSNLPHRWRFKKTDRIDTPEFEGYRAFRGALYDGALRSLDDQLARLLGILEDRGLLERTVVAVTSDHGEEMWDHWQLQRAAYDEGERPHMGYAHGHTLFQELLHVPLVLAGPGVPVGRRSPARVSTLHLGATLLELAAGRPSPLGEGQSLLARMAGGADPGADPVFAEGLAHGPELQSFVDESGLKLIRSRVPGERDLLFDLARDPRETRDLASERSGEAQRLRTRLEELGVRLEATRTPSAVPEDRPSSAELEALGYAGDS